MRDFSSAVVVQGALVLDMIAHGELDLPVPALDRAIAAQWCEATLRHWARTQRANGSFDENYPGEAGFPAAGFSLYAAAVIARRTPPTVEIARAMEKAAAWILRSAETEAGNQEIIALAGCSLVARAGVRVDAAAGSSGVGRPFTQGSHPRGGTRNTEVRTPDTWRWPATRCGTAGRPRVTSAPVRPACTPRRTSTPCSGWRVTCLAS